jgi:nucleotide-binding universal stress UspA family protein
MTVPFRQAVVGVDANERDAELVRYASVLPRLSPEVEVHFVHVLGWPARVPPGAAPLTHQQALKQLEDTVARNYAGPRAVCRVVLGNLVDCLLEQSVAASADVLMVGHRAEHSRRRATARRLAMKAPCSVWMRPEGGPQDVRRVLAAVDFSMPSACALSLAAQIAQRSNSAECLALHAYFSGGIAGNPDDRRIEQDNVNQEFARFLAPLDTHGVRIKSLVEENPNVAHAVEQTAEREGADLIVMGNRGQTRSASILLGSESEHMLMETRLPVLIVKRKGERISLVKALLDREFHLPESPRFG